MSASRCPVSVTTTSVPRRPPTGFMLRMTGLTARTCGATIVKASEASKIGLMAMKDPGKEMNRYAGRLLKNAFPEQVTSP